MKIRFVIKIWFLRKSQSKILVTNYEIVMFFIKLILTYPSNGNKVHISAKIVIRVKVASFTMSNPDSGRVKKFKF